MQSDRRAVMARVTGKVQGVSFRVWARQEARKLGLRGWVRNEDDGSVSALLAGESQAVSTMLERLRTGPPGARVTNVVARPAEGSDEPDDFRIRV